MPFNKMMEKIREDRLAADKEIQDWQRKLKPGDLITRHIHGITVYGLILDPIPLNISNSGDKEELNEIKEMFNDEWASSYRYGHFYSVACVEGEYGDIHLSTIDKKITIEEFLIAMISGWSG